jgi:hypothetical protein
LEDFHFDDLRRPVRPLVVGVRPDLFAYLAVRLGAGDPQPAMAGLADVWAQFAGLRPFEPVFLDPHLNAMYRTEATLSTLVGAVRGAGHLRGVPGPLRRGSVSWPERQSPASATALRYAHLRFRVNRC